MEHHDKEFTPGLDTVQSYQLLSCLTTATYLIVQLHNEYELVVYTKTMKTKDHCALERTTTSAALFWFSCNLEALNAR
jgi:hypothetical protein